MKVSIVVALAMATLGTTPAEADCGCGAWLLTDQVVEGKPYIVLAAACVGFSKQQPKLALVDAAGKRIPTTTVTTHDGHSNHGQLVFSPDRAIAPGAYQVTYDDRFELSRLKLTVVAAPSKAAPPTWQGTARVLGQKQSEFGCGPAKSVFVEAGPDATLAFVELVDDARRRHTGYVPVQDGKLSIGHGMCGGPFALARGHRYTAQVTLLAPARGTSSSSKSTTFTYSP